MLKTVFLGATAALALSAPASAATVFNLGAPTGETASPGNYTYNFTAGAGAGQLDFQIQGYRTLDGQNCCTDTVTVLLNGSQMLVGTYDLGGGGANVTTFLLPGAGLALNTPARTLTFSAGAVTLLNGNNTLSFSYDGGAQGVGDEAWGINSATVLGNAFNNGVPEPSAWALMILGFGAVGGALRGRRRVRTALTYA